MMINPGVFQLSVIMVIIWLSRSMPEILGYIYHYAKIGVSATTLIFFSKIYAPSPSLPPCLHLKMYSMVGYPF